jgi:hypothetical protein
MQNQLEDLSLRIYPSESGRIYPSPMPDDLNLRKLENLSLWSSEGFLKRRVVVYRYLNFQTPNGLYSPLPLVYSWLIFIQNEN